MLELVTGRPPFSELNAVNALSTMAEEDPDVPEWIDTTCKSFIRRCIVRQAKSAHRFLCSVLSDVPIGRANAAELLIHAYIRTCATQNELVKLVNLSALYAAPES